MRETKITCDNCKKDLTETGRRPAYRLVLSSESIPHSTNIPSFVLIRPEIEQDRYFCNLACLRNWLADR